ncbi:MAG: ROK family protein [Candidatus Bipolaricaulota bacterium]
MSVVAVDIGGTQTRVARLEGGRLNDRRAFPTQDLDVLIAAIAAVDPDGLDAVGIAFAGALDMRRGCILNSPNLKGWQDLNLPAELGKRLGRPVYLGNDASCAALGELTRGSRARDFAYVTWSTGIGGGFVSGGRVLWGSTGMAAEVGHIVLWPDGPLCDCGKHGCLEAIASGTGIRRLTQEKMGSALSAEETVARAQKGERIPEEIVETACRAMAQGLAIVSELLEPEVLVLGGGITRSWAYLGTKVERALSAMARSAPPLRLTELGDDVGLYGAAALPEHWPEHWPPPAHSASEA